MGPSLVLKFSPRGDLKDALVCCKSRSWRHALKVFEELRVRGRGQTGRLGDWLPTFGQIKGWGYGQIMKLDHEDHEES